MLSSGTKCYHLGQNVIIWDEILSFGANVIIWDKCYHRDERLSSGMLCFDLELMLSSGTKCYHLGCNFIILDAILLSGANVII
jgi:hypothetical protein